MSDAMVSRAPNLRAYICVLVVSALTSLALTGIALYRFHQIEPAHVAPTAATGPHETSIAKTSKKMRPVIEAALTPSATTGTEESKPRIATGAAPETGRASGYDLASATASGETMEGDDLTAAHPSLPLGTHVLVENLDNGRFVVVRINDRGPFTHNRIIDVSKAAAERLDMVADGVANVRVSRIEGDVASISAPR